VGDLCAGQWVANLKFQKVSHNWRQHTISVLVYYARLKHKLRMRDDAVKSRKFSLLRRGPVKNPYRSYHGLVLEVHGLNHQDWKNSVLLCDSQTLAVPTLISAYLAARNSSYQLLQVSRGQG
jgi:hypothetical protein